MKIAALVVLVAVAEPRGGAPAGGAPMAPAPVTYPFTQHAGDPKQVNILPVKPSDIPGAIQGLGWGASIEEAHRLFPAWREENPTASSRTFLTPFTGTARSRETRPASSYWSVRGRW